jgi:hypothetical protein
MKNIIILAIATTMLFESCYTTRTIPISWRMDEWLGVSEHAVLMKMGPPNSTTSDGQDGKILDYRHSSLTTYLNNYTGILTAETYSRDTYMQLYINKEGKVYTWRTNMPDEQYQVKRKGATAALTILLSAIFAVLLIANSGSNSGN